MVYIEIASTGHAETHDPQSIQVPSSQTDFASSFIDRAPTGQTPTQAPQPMQVSSLIITGILNSSFTTITIIT